MNEKEFAAKLKPWLDKSAAQVGELQATRLKAARLKALDAHRQPASVLGLGGGLLGMGRQALLQRALLFLPLLALVAWLAFQSLSTDVDLGEIDAQLLSQELPPDAFIDQEFRSWLGKSSR